ncbi:protein of unknown function [Shinella sp. WSC3-e]|nr:hypothetical protein SHINE37_42944 [Rhizobiaceae bacterium]CAK7257506.1 protein of unknown function [Shinella sp. WSC3-e]
MRVRDLVGVFPLPSSALPRSLRGGGVVQGEAQSRIQVFSIPGSEVDLREKMLAVNGSRSLSRSPNILINEFQSGPAPAIRVIAFGILCPLSATRYAKYPNPRKCEQQAENSPSPWVPTEASRECRPE